MDKSEITEGLLFELFVPLRIVTQILLADALIRQLYECAKSSKSKILYRYLSFGKEGKPFQPNSETW